MKNNVTKVLVVDDHVLMRIGLATILGVQTDMVLAGEASGGDEAVAKVRSLRPDVVVMDLLMPGVDGIAATERIKNEMPETRVLVLTTSTSSDDFGKALAAGASGVITKSEATANLVDAIRAVARGETVLSKEAKNQLERDPPAADLTERQRIILCYMAKGLTNKDIAMSLGCSHESVKDRIKTICGKLGAANRTEAVAIALRKRIIGV